MVMGLLNVNAFSSHTPPPDVKSVYTTTGPFHGV